MCDPDFMKKSDSGASTSSNLQQSSSNSQSVSLVSFNRADIYLQTGYAYVSSNACNQRLIRVIMDSASQRTFIREDISKQLKLPVISMISMNILPFGSNNMAQKAMYNCVELKLRSQYSDSYIVLKAIEIPQICVDVLPIPDSTCLDLRGIELADVKVDETKLISGIGLLVGADNYWRLVSGERKMITDRLALVNTKLGWTLHGPSAIDDAEDISSMALFTSSSFNVTVENYWKLEAIGVDNDTDRYSTDFTTEFIKSNIERKGNRYEVLLPWKNCNCELNRNYMGALRRLNSLTQRLIKEQTKLFEYDKHMWEMIRAGIAEPVSGGKNRIYYLPHRAVYRDDKATTKVRIVFDASAHSPGQKSINDYLHQGPNLLPDLLSILLNFRNGHIGIIADIEKAFLQISLNPNDRDSHRFLWYEQPIKTLKSLPPIKAYRMTRLTFGVNCSPFILNAVIKRHLEEWKKRYSLTCEILSTCFYVDDLIASVHSLDAARRLFKEAKEVLSDASMNLRKWRSNDEGLRQEFNEKGYNETNDVNQKVLGVVWRTATDEIKIDFTTINAFITTTGNTTKRSILQIYSSLYDPLGIIGPFTLRIKLLMQSIWKLKIEWDDPLTSDLQAEWDRWVFELKELASFSIQRCVLDRVNVDIRKTVQLHIFADASPRAYGAVAFIRQRTINGNVSVHLLVAKNRISPLGVNNENELSLPKLELTAALLAARLKAFIEAKTNFKLDDVYLWTDSRITLCWIQGLSNRKWQQYVANRVSEINKLSSVSQWRHCPGNTNPADLLTKGVKANVLCLSELWKFGPSWLSENEENWPAQTNIDSSTINVALTTCIPELSSTYGEPVIMISNYSKLYRLLRVTAYVFRFVNNANKRRRRLGGELVAEEIERAETYWIQIEQQQHFADELATLRTGKSIDRHSKILKLRPFLDDKGLLRLRSRLQDSEDSFEVSHPIILPKNSPLSFLLARQQHEDTHHSGTNVVISQLRKRFWIICARVLVKRAVKGCYQCRRVFSKPASQPFAPLPRDRLLPARPFEVTGMDFAGPLYVKADDGQQMKVYLLLFTCAVVRALHLEVVKGLTTESCLSAIRRFIARRGVPKIIYSDNARTFKRADYEIERLYKGVKAEQITSFAAHRGIRWKYIVERAPWWGGWWERLVRTVKNSLKVTIGRALLNYEQLETLVVEIEAVVNSRPLTYISEDAQDLQPLTPFSILLGQTMTSLPTGQVPNGSTKEAVCQLWKQRQMFVDRFRKRWTSEYLHQLKSAHFTSNVASKTVKEGDVMILAADKSSRLMWPLCRVSTVYYGRDGRVRSCEVTLADGKKLRRPIQLLHPLEVQQ